MPKSSQEGVKTVEIRFRVVVHIIHQLIDVEGRPVGGAVETAGDAVFDLLFPADALTGKVGTAAVFQPGGKEIESPAEPFAVR